ncbi:response regulator [Fulvivirgaceae bacterium PWU5]|uniref:histidine kinase n=1 Tax=Dawidia cretensis TaxID=2782350 RepID=A0AAP2E338_9BACT|nr:hybrid sensor histidine kinase/response regulator transcription factor [Dawidia cretensis]MBT1711835.1 response regulator [Dawidia cretensis]
MNRDTKGLCFSHMLRGFILVASVLLLTAFIPHEPKNRIRHYGIREGLSQGVVNSITQDEQSLMWFATEDGLNRFDGYSFKVFKYDPDNARGLADNFIQSIFKDSQGDFWVSSRKGLHRFDQLKEQFTLYKHSLPAGAAGNGNDVSFIAEGGARNLWVAWYGAGFASFNTTTHTFTPYTDKTLSGLTSTQTLTLLEDKFGLLWVGTQNGGLDVFQVSKGAVLKKHESLSDKKLLPSHTVRCFAEDQAGNLWIGTANGLVLYKRQENTFYTFNGAQFGIAGKSIFTLLADSHENLWIGVQGGGLYALDLRQLGSRNLDDVIFKRIQNLDTYNISKRTILSLYEDKNKNLWVGTFGDGVYMMSGLPEKFVKFQRKQYNDESLSYVQYYGMCYDADGNLWLGTDGDGIYRVRSTGETTGHYKADGRPGSLKDNAVLSAFRDHHNNLWFGTYSQGLFRYDKQHDRFEHYRYLGDPALTGAHDVRVIFEDVQHTLWVGTNRGGLCRVDETRRGYSQVPGAMGVLRDGDIRAIAEDSTGGLWLGCYGDGVHYRAAGAARSQRYFYSSDTVDQLKSNVVFALRFDRKDMLWIGTGGGGLSVYNPGRKALRRFSDKRGLANNTVYAILADHADNLWLSTNKGISKYDPTAEKFINYDVNDGLQEGQFNPGAALYNELAGYMCFGGTMAYNLFYPDQVEQDIMKPRVMISGFQLFNKPVEVNARNGSDFVLRQVISRTPAIALTHDQSVFTFDFVGINYSYPEKNVYAYKLEGLDRDWNYVGAQRSATYRYVAPGDYVFKVKASNQEDAWSDEYAHIAVTILPPFWRTPLAYSLYMVVGGGLCFAIVTVRKKQATLRKRLKIEKAQRKRERRLVQEKLTFFTEISHEFRTPLTLMIGPLEEMVVREGSYTPNGRKLKMVYRNAHKLLSLINKLLDYRKIESGNIVLHVTEDDLVAFVEEICITFQELAVRKNIAFRFHADLPSLPAWFDKEKMEMVITNIISNSFKYIGNGNEISVSLHRQASEKWPQGKVLIKVKDNGIGIPRKQLGSVFDWFYRGDRFMPMSSGIGLALAKKLVNLHRGEIYVESTEGSGSTFSVKFLLGKDHFKPNEIVADAGENKFLLQPDPAPVPSSSLLLEEAVNDTTGRKGQRCLLIVEDDEDIRTFLREYFEKDYHVLEAVEGREGLTLAAEHHIDLVISDIMMPGMNGIDFCRELKNNIRTSHIPVVLLTAKTSLTHHKEGIEIGGDAYITKPFSPEMLTLTINNLLQSRETLKRFYRNLFATQTPVTALSASQSPDEKFLHAIYEMLLTNLDHKDFNVNELCEALNMSRSLLYKKVKLLTGLSPVEYLRSLRMQEAAKLLKSKKYKVFEVVYMVGFSDLKYFRQCFVKEFGYSPSDFLKNAGEMG